jgi:Uma2 family endonuclease
MIEPMSAATRPRYSIEEYVRIEEHANLKHEYLDGQVLAMAGGTPEHARMASAVNAALLTQLRGRPCAVYTSDARVRVAATGLDTYPDVTVVCGGEQRDPGDPLALTNPVVLVEITSPSSEAYDRGEKFEHYKRIPTLREFVVVSHHEPCIEVFRRSADGSWADAEQTLRGGRVTLTSLACELVVDDIYVDPFAT